jgi:hypothetical protein
MFKWRIDPFPPDEGPPYAHLEPIVDALLAAGNEVAGPSKFYLDRDGWRADLRRPINFGLIEERFDLPDSILLAKSRDAVLCQNTWIEIRGGVANGQ